MIVSVSSQTFGFNWLMLFAGEKNHSCEVCGARFSDPSSKRRHVKEHSGFKPYSCQLCGDTFKRTSNLKSHLANKHTKGAHTTEMITVNVKATSKQAFQGNQILLVSDQDLMHLCVDDSSKELCKPAKQVICRDIISAFKQHIPGTESPKDDSWTVRDT